MARIRNCGELELYSVLESIDARLIEEETLVDQKYWVVVMRLLLDKPIKIEKEFFKYFLEENLRSEVLAAKISATGSDCFHLWYFPEVMISKGKLCDPEQKEKDWWRDQCGEIEFEKDPDNVLETKDFIIMKRLLPKDIVQAMVKQKAYPKIFLTLYPDKRRFGIPYLCDLEIEIRLNKPVRSPDRFFKAFARKLNKWLAAAK